MQYLPARTVCRESPIRRQPLLLRVIVIKQTDKKDDESLIFVLILGIIGWIWWNSNITTQPVQPVQPVSVSVQDPFKVDYNPPFIVNFYPTISQSSFITGNVRFKNAPQDVINLARQHTDNEMQAKFLLSLCYHERGIKNWYDNYLCGYGATDTKWYSKYAGWQKQLSYSGTKVRGWFRNKTINHDTTLGFAKYAYGTTDWQHYSRVWEYYRKMGGF